MKRARTILNSALGLLVLAGLAVGVGALIRVTVQPGAVAGPPQATRLSARPTRSPAIPTAPSESSAPTIPPSTPYSPTPSPAEMPWADAEAILLFVSSDKLQWLPAGERLTEGMPAQAGRVVEQVDRAIEATEFVVRLYPSPDGRYVVFFAASAPPRDEIARAYVWSPHLDQPPRVIVAEVDWSLKFFGWRPHTRQVVWGGEDIWLLDVETGERTSLIAQPKEWADLPYDPAVHGVAVSPDGRRMIVSFTLTGEDFEVWSANIDGTEPRRLFVTMGGVYHLTWSPNGKWVSCISPNGFEVMSPDGEGRRTFGTVPIGGLAPAWSPDSRYLAFTVVNDTPSAPSHDVPPDSGFDFSPYTVRIADVLTGEERDLVEDAIGGEIGARWSPDGKWYSFRTAAGPPKSGSPTWTAPICARSRSTVSPNALRRCGYPSHGEESKAMQRQSAMTRAAKIGIVLTITLVTAAVFPDIPRRAVAHAPTPFLASPYYGPPGDGVSQRWIAGSHNGIDFLLRYAPVLAAADGTIDESRWNVTQPVTMTIGLTAVLPPGAWGYTCASTTARPTIPTTPTTVTSA